MWFLTKSGRHSLWEASFGRGDVLVLGSETRGLPAALLETHAARTLMLPMQPEVRSLNLASTATAVIYEALRQFETL
jgi:tRNA (cytidine/uridine-2'-O-)-methyltransferase